MSWQEERLVHDRKKYRIICTDKHGTSVVTRSGKVRQWCDGPEDLETMEGMAVGEEREVWFCNHVGKESPEKATVTRLPDETVIPDERDWFTKLLHLMFGIRWEP